MTQNVENTQQLVKKVFTYEEIKQIILDKVPELEKKGYDEIIAVSRGGVTIAHLLSQIMFLPLGYLFPVKRELISYNKMHGKEVKKVLIIEDKIALGETTKIIHEMMKNYDLEYDYIPFFVDEHYTKQDYTDTFIVTKDWVVFPWVDNEKEVAGVRAKFRRHHSQIDLLGDDYVSL